MKIWSLRLLLPLKNNAKSLGNTVLYQCTRPVRENEMALHNDFPPQWFMQSVIYSPRWKQKWVFLDSSFFFYKKPPGPCIYWEKSSSGDIHEDAFRIASSCLSLCCNIQWKQSSRPHLGTKCSWSRATITITQNSTYIDKSLEVIIGIKELKNLLGMFLTNELIRSMLGTLFI